MKWRVLLSLSAVVFLYLVIGGIAFHYLEGEAEKEQHVYLENITKQFLEDNKCVSDLELEVLLITILTAYDRGVIEFSNRSSPSNWDLASSLFFSITVVTTIGYGHIYPATAGGRTLCVVYAVLGIPLSLTLLAAIGHKLRQLFARVDDKLDVCNTRSKLAKLLRAIFILMAGLTCFLFLPAIMFVMIDGWSYGEALYYCCITLTTIGFGDLVPGLEDTDKNRSLYRVMVGVWIFVGLAWVAGVISFVQQIFMALIQKAQVNLEKRGGQRSGEASNKHVLQDEQVDCMVDNCSSKDASNAGHSSFASENTERPDQKNITEATQKPEVAPSTNI